MRKAFIRTAIDLALAENGYPISYYGWIRPGWLEVWNGNPDHPPRRLRIPAIHSFKEADLIEALSVLRPIGPPIPAPPRLHPVPEPEQVELEAFLKALDEKPKAEAAASAEKRMGIEAPNSSDAFAYSVASQAVASGDAPQIAWFREDVSLDEVIDHLSGGNA